MIFWLPCSYTQVRAEPQHHSEQHTVKQRRISHGKQKVEKRERETRGLPEQALGDNFLQLHSPSLSLPPSKQYHQILTSYNESFNGLNHWLGQSQSSWSYHFHPFSEHYLGDQTSSAYAIMSYFKTKPQEGTTNVYLFRWIYLSLVLTTCTRTSRLGEEKGSCPEFLTSRRQDIKLPIDFLKWRGSACCRSVLEFQHSGDKSSKTVSWEPA